MKLKITPGRLILWVLFSPVLLFFRLLGWKIVGLDIHTTDYPKILAIAAPHTANWDGIMIIPAAMTLVRRPKWMVKRELIKGPMLALLANWAGIIPVERSARHNMVEQAIALMNQRRELVLVMTPEGTRKRVDYWKSGFYHIAMATGVPIGIVGIDYRTKEAGFVKIFQPTGDLEQDLATIRETVERITPRHPDQASPVRLRPQDEESAPASEGKTG